MFERELEHVWFPIVDSRLNRTPFESIAEDAARDAVHHGVWIRFEGLMCTLSYPLYVSEDASTSIARFFSSNTVRNVVSRKEFAKSIIMGLLVEALFLLLVSSLA